MKSLKFLTKQKNLKPLILRQIVGRSMLPKLENGQILIASGWFRSLRPHDMIIVLHEGREKVKRIHQIRGGQLYVVGDNSAESTDSRDFGWLSQELVAAKVIWPRS